MQIGEVPFPFSPRLLRWILLLLIAFPPILVSCDEIAVGLPPGKLQLPPGEPVEGSPGAKPGAVMACNRVHIRGVLRLRHPNLFFHSLKVKVNLSSRQIVALGFPPNASRGVGMCPSGEWRKLSKGSWLQNTSPFSDKILDVRMHPGRPSAVVEVSTEGEFMPHRMVLLILGIVLMAFARMLSESVVFYYGGAMAVGVILVFLMVLFQGMKLLPTGRKGSVAIFLYSSIVGVATFLLHYLSGLLRSALMEMGISEDIHKPLGVFFLLCLFLAGAWLGFWSVRKLVLDESGSVDQGIAYFVEWSLLIFAAAMILQSSIDTLLATEALLLDITVTLSMRSRRKLRFLRRLYRRISGLFCRTQDKSSPYKNLPAHGAPWTPKQSPASQAKSPASPLCRTDATGLTTKPAPQEPLKGQTYYSTFHVTPERKKFSKEEWKAFTRDSTRRAMEELSTSPDFARWVANNAERITVNPIADGTKETWTISLVLGGLMLRESSC
ncbi:unnamed protein product [Spirodela intermedia]|uniref:Uncharacterized protein n=1 Tax=Spirodela intermedia TaxID=51605 RepID=A0ABN7ECH8_SPIIN|nr:unnamed protein product [Spirodela intermedia]